MADVTDWSHDLVLRALQDLAEPVGTLVRAFPGRTQASADPGWLDDWFLSLACRFAEGDGPDPKKIVVSEAEYGALSLLAKRPVEASVRIVSVRPQYFRGFRNSGAAIRIDPDLVVVEGRNSSGKTSLAEAIEWVFTGQLSRRTSGEQGHPTELANCIANQFRPEAEATRVELTLDINGTSQVWERVLHRDYSTIATDVAASTLMVDGRALTTTEEQALREYLLAGVHPILMQHTLRRFVHDDPNSRRQYFERLLQIDEFTCLIEKAVIGTTTLKQLPNPGGGIGLPALRTLSQELEKVGAGQHSALISSLRKIERLADDRVPTALQSCLVNVAYTLFPLDCPNESDLTTCRERLAEAQRVQREARLPLLAVFEAARSHTILPVATAQAAADNLTTAITTLESKQKSASAISEATQQLARVIEGLLASGDLSDDAEVQVCPLCDYLPPTLMGERLRRLREWAPLATALSIAQQSIRDARRQLGEQLDRVTRSLDLSLPQLPSADEVERQLQGATPRVVALAHSCVSSALGVRSAGALALKALQQFTDAVNRDNYADARLVQHMDECDRALALLAPLLAAHRAEVANLEEAVGASSRDDATYRLRERWLEVASLTSAIASDVAWENAKTLAKDALDGLRSGLITLRSRIIEHARQTFSSEMTTIWHLLRSDSGARFSALTIPPAKGKGYKLEFELKAVISDGQSAPEVDALRVFSESQVNVVGVAAYITRATLLGHRFLIFDDPVQSMDEEHFRSFATKLLPSLIDDGFQVIVLTHSDTFARRIHDHHYLRSSYATLETHPSKRKGCYVREGNRRVSERLNNARRLATEGDLQGAWRLIRLAMERMYTLAYARGKDGFDPETWRNMSAEDMWNQGAGKAVQAKAPESAVRLREILTATAAGAHDKTATSETDVVDACDYLLALLTPLHLGDG